MNEIQKVLMIYPKIEASTFWSYKYSLKLLGKKALIPPLGLITVAAMLPKNFDIKLTDMNVSAIEEKDVIWADIIFISAMIVQKTSFHNVIMLCKEHKKEIVAGGPYPSSSYNEIEGIDYFIVNEAENTLPKFLKDLQRGNPRKVYYSDEKPDIKNTPLPRYDLINPNNYLNLALQFSRGCPYNCEFCDIIEMFGRKMRTKTPTQFIKELEVIYKIGYRGSIFIVDDNFIGNKKNAKELLKEMIVWQKNKKFPFRFMIEASINLAEDNELMDLIVESGFTTIFIGFESPNEGVLKKAGKLQNIKENMLKSSRIIEEKGLLVMAGFILGLDGESEDIFDHQIAFISNAAIPIAMIGILIALPNTQLYRRLLKENRLTSTTHGNNTYEININYIPEMPIERLASGYIRIISEIYKPKKYFQRCIKFLERIPQKSIQVTPISIIKFIKLFLVSIMVQGFSKYGHFYFFYLIKALVVNHKNFPIALSLALRGEHFIKTSRDFLSNINNNNHN